MKVYPDIIKNFEKFNGENLFDPIKLLGTISNSESYNENKHDILTAVTRNKLPYRMYYSFGHNFSEYPTLVFTIGSDVAVDTVLVISSIEGSQLKLNFVPQNNVFNQLLQRKFPPEYREIRLTKSSESISTYA